MDGSNPQKVSSVVGKSLGILFIGKFLFIMDLFMFLQSLD